MLKERNEDQLERPDSKVKKALVWIAILALAVFPYPWWP